MIFTVSESDTNNSLRLDLYLLINNKGLSRNFISNAIKRGLVHVNGNSSVKSSYKVKIGDSIDFNINGAKKEINELEYENVKPVKMDLDIIYEDSDLLVVNKPSGVATHPSKGHLENTLLNGVHWYLHEESKNSLRKHMVHRLDKDTSGLIAFAKTDQMLWWLHKQFAERKVGKMYYALSFASKKYNSGEKFSIEGYLERSKKEGKKYMFSNKYGRWTHTDFEIQKSFMGEHKHIKQYFTLIKCFPKTGRTHQIRVHLKQANLPIWADIIYSSDKQYKFAEEYSKDKKIPKILFLQSSLIQFTSYNGKEYHVELSLSKDLNRIISSLDEKN